MKSTSTKYPTIKPGRRIEHIILDLDETLISSCIPDEVTSQQLKKLKGKFKYGNFEDEYVIFARPHLQTFLKFVFSNFKVTVFTAASREYAAYIVEKFVLTDPETQLAWFFWSYHCKSSAKHYRQNNKNIRLLPNNYFLNDDFDVDTTLLIDDHPKWTRGQKDSVVMVKPFEALEALEETYVPDKELLDIMEFLKQFVKENV